MPGGAGHMQFSRYKHNTRKIVRMPKELLTEALRKQTRSACPLRLRKKLPNAFSPDQTLRWLPSITSSIDTIIAAVVPSVD